MWKTKPKLNASTSQLILNCRIDKHNNKEINLIEHRYITSAEKTMQSLGLGASIPSKHQTLHKRAITDITQKSRRKNLWLPRETLE